MYGTQTDGEDYYLFLQFENDVKMYGTQTIYGKRWTNNGFENDVKMYGTQTCLITRKAQLSLRMM